MEKERRAKIQKKTILIVSISACILLCAGAVLGLWSSREMQNLVADQFSQEQLVIARHVSSLIERKMALLQRELLLLREEAPAPFDPASFEEAAKKTFSRVLETGVWKIEVVDLNAGNTCTFMPYQYWISKEVDKDTLAGFPSPEILERGEAWTSRPLGQPQRISLLLGLPIKGESRIWLLFHVNVSWLLAPFFTEIHSGKTGYAWLIDSRGTFLSHPNRDFVGHSALEIREETYPDIPFRRINFIQKEEMLEGKSGTGWYYSGWHRGISGKLKKLIAYCPVTVADNPPQRWSVAVVAPVSEIENAVREGNLRQLLVHGLIILVILLGTGTILFFEIRWSRILEEQVEKRTAELKKSEDRYRSLVESAEDFIFSVDSGGRFQSLNSFTANFFGGAPEEFLGKGLDSVFPPKVAEKQIGLVNLVHEYGKSVRDELKWEMGEHEIWISANFMPLKGEGGKINAVLCIARDITENKILERQLVNAEKLASMGTLAAGVAHEINNPLGVILGFCDLLVRKAEKGSQEYEDLKTIERQGLHCKEVVENLLSFARHGEGISEYCNIVQCLKEIIRVVKHTLEMNDIELRLDLAEGLPAVRGDSRQLQQVFLNLINNAISAMAGGGELAIRAFSERRTRRVVVEFQDSGRGIRKEDMDHIFEPFFTTKPEGEGTGLGLFVSYGIVAKYGGSLDCVSHVATPSRPGETTFAVKLLAKRGEQ